MSRFFLLALAILFLQPTLVVAETTMVIPGTTIEVPAIPTKKSATLPEELALLLKEMSVKPNCDVFFALSKKRLCEKRLAVIQPIIFQIRTDLEISNAALTSGDQKKADDALKRVYTGIEKGNRYVADELGYRYEDRNNVPPIPTAFKAPNAPPIPR